MPRIETPADDRARPMSRGRIILAVCVAWLVIGVIVGLQTAVGAAFSGAMKQPLGLALRSSVVQSLPWIPVTLAAIALAVRWPLRRATWHRVVLLHLGAALTLAFLANVLVTLSFWVMRGRFGGIGALIEVGAVWALIRLHIALLIYASVVGITHVVLDQRRAREREVRLARMQEQLALAQVQALNAQMRPHFLFNTLHTIGQLWRSGRSDDADAMLDHLGSLFRIVQASSRRATVPLGEEMDMVRQYLAIEQARFRDRLRATISVADSALGCLVPPLILQPIVENAIRHGISALSSAGSVQVSASRDNGQLTLTVRDDGPGPSATTAQRGSGAGIRNARERLEQLYGDTAWLSIEEPPEGGTLVTIALPAEPAIEGA